MKVLEVIAFDIGSCRMIEHAGAHRIELCANPHEGGTTPSVGLVQQAMHSVQIPVFVMIRPRGGDFLYSVVEYAVMQEDIRYCKAQHCKGVVLGLLNRDGTVDYDRTAKLVELAWPMEVTFHRAFDRVNDPEQALEVVINTGCNRILTSGLMPKAEQGIQTLASLIRQAGERIVIMPGSGINSGNIRRLATELNAAEFHTSARTLVAGNMEYTNEAMNEDLRYVQVDEEEVRRSVNELNSYV
jgi:copper homeostasis protein